MSRVYDDLDFASATIKKVTIDGFDKIYPFTNENIFKTFNRFNLKNKKILSVLASSDQIFDIFLKEPKKIDTFDLNPLTKYYFYLKKACIQSGLSLEDFFNFFCYSKYLSNSVYTVNQKAFDKNVFNKVSKNLDSDNYIFWNELFSKYDSLYLRKNLFTRDDDTKNTLKRQVKYLNDKSYKKLQNNINNVNITFVNSNIIDLPYKLERSYDFMYFSNIIQYADDMYEDRYLDTYKNQIYKLEEFKKMINDFKLHLNKNGKILLGYVFQPETVIPSIAIFNPEVKEHVFNKNEFNYFKISTTKDKSIEIDECIVYTKKR